MGNQERTYWELVEEVAVDTFHDARPGLPALEDDDSPPSGFSGNRAVLVHTWISI